MRIPCIGEITSMALRDHKNHDFTVGIGGGSTGLTIHCSVDSIPIAGPRLQNHCARRKYTQKAKTWFGLCITPKGTLRFGINLDYKWEQSKEMEADTQHLSRTGKAGLPSAPVVRNRKIGRNDPCPCGSGLKYKKCHGK